MFLNLFINSFADEKKNQVFAVIINELLDKALWIVIQHVSIFYAQSTKIFNRKGNYIEVMTETKNFKL